MNCNSARGAAAEAAIADAGWDQPFHIDADHINLGIVEGYLTSSDFFTIDVADSIGQPADPDQLNAFLDRHPELTGTVVIEGIDSPIQATREEIGQIVKKLLQSKQGYRQFIISLGRIGIVVTF